MSWFGYVWIVILVIIYGLCTIKWWKEAITEKDFEYIVVWLILHILILFLSSMIYFVWQRGR